MKIRTFVVENLRIAGATTLGKTTFRITAHSITDSSSTTTTIQCHYAERCTVIDMPSVVLPNVVLLNVVAPNRVSNSNAHTAKRE